MEVPLASIRQRSVSHWERKEMQRIYLDDFINFPVTKFKKGKQKNLVLHLDFRSKQICYGSKATPKRIIPFSILSSITVSADATKRFHLHLHDAPPVVLYAIRRGDILQIQAEFKELIQNKEFLIKCAEPPKLHTYQMVVRYGEVEKRRKRVNWSNRLLILTDMQLLCFTHSPHQPQSMPANVIQLASIRCVKLVGKKETSFKIISKSGKIIYRASNKTATLRWLDLITAETKRLRERKRTLTAGKSMQGKPELPHLDQHEIEFQSLHQLFAQASTFIDLKVHYLEIGPEQVRKRARSRSFGTPPPVQSDYMEKKEDESDGVKFNPEGSPTAQRLAAFQIDPFQASFHPLVRTTSVLSFHRSSLDIRREVEAKKREWAVLQDTIREQQRQSAAPGQFQFARVAVTNPNNDVRTRMSIGSPMRRSAMASMGDEGQVVGYDPRSLKRSARLKALQDKSNTTASSTTTSTTSSHKEENGEKEASSPVKDMKRLRSPVPPGSPVWRPSSKPVNSVVTMDLSRPKKITGIEEVNLGAMFIKFAQGRAKAVAHKRFVVVEEDLSVIRVYKKGKESQSKSMKERRVIALKEVVDICSGHKTELFQRQGKPGRDSLAFSVCYFDQQDERTLDLEAATTEVRDLWVSCLKEILHVKQEEGLLKSGG